jgi:hypothetical protein
VSSSRFFNVRASIPALSLLVTIRCDLITANGDEFPAPDDDTLDTYLSQYRLSNLLPIFIVSSCLYSHPTSLLFQPPPP